MVCCCCECSWIALWIASLDILKNVSVVQFELVNRSAEHAEMCFKKSFLYYCLVELMVTLNIETLMFYTAFFPTN